MDRANRKKGLWARHVRPIAQIGFTALSNGNLKGFLTGRIYRGQGKRMCLPGLNCYSCPGALGACPIGSIQAVEGSAALRVSCYVTGLLILFGALLGRFVCGWLCPFGLVEDLVYKIPFFKKVKKLPLEPYLRKLRYVVLVLLVLTLPSILIGGVGTPWFCKLLCPSGMLMGGIPLVLTNAQIAAAVGGLFWWKLSLLVAILLLSLYIWRPFCRYLCPLGAIYGLFNPVAALKLHIDADRCTRCGRCQAACNLDLPVYEKPNGADCVRCGDCIRACPHDAIGIKKKSA